MKPLYGLVVLVTPCRASRVLVSHSGLKSMTNMTPASVPASSYSVRKIWSIFCVMNEDLRLNYSHRIHLLPQQIDDQY